MIMLNPSKKIIVRSKRFKKRKMHAYFFYSKWNFYLHIGHFMTRHIVAVFVIIYFFTVCIFRLCFRSWLVLKLFLIYLCLIRPYPCHAYQSESFWQSVFSVCAYILENFYRGKKQLGFKTQKQKKREKVTIWPVWRWYQAKRVILYILLTWRCIEII